MNGFDRGEDNGVKKTRWKVSLSFWDVSCGNSSQRKALNAYVVTRQTDIGLDMKEQGGQLDLGQRESEGERKIDSELQCD